MSQTRVLVLLAGAAISATALAGNPDQDRAYAAELKADALNKSSALESNGIGSLAEGDSKVNLGGFTQFRYYMNFRDDPGNGSPHDSGFTNGFEAPRTRLQATGNVLSKDFTFKVEGQFGSTGEFSLLDAFARWAFDGGHAVVIGQFQNPLWREWALSPKGVLGADYSVVTAVYNPGYTQGVAWNYRADAWNVLVSANDGIQSGNTPYTTPAAQLGGPGGTGVGGLGESDIGVSARLEFKGGGDWKLFDDFSGWRGQETAWLVGLGGAWQKDGNTASTGTSFQGQQARFAVDGQIEGNGWNIYALALWARTDPDSGNASIDDFAGVLQGGYMFTDNIEAFVGWNGIFADKDWGVNADQDFHTALVGMNFYPFAKSSAVKFTVDGQWFFNKTTESAPVNSAINGVTGLRASGEDNQVALRFQLQVAF
jgi:hypothetical protein